MNQADKDKVIAALEAVDALINHQYTGSRDAMSALQNAADDCRECIDIMRGVAAEPVAWKLNFTDEDGISHREVFHSHKHLQEHVRHNSEIRGLKCRVTPLYTSPHPPEADKHNPLEDLDCAKMMVRSAGYSLVSADFIAAFAEFIQDWRKGDFDLPKLAALDVKACFDAWQADVNQAEVKTTKNTEPNTNGTDYVSDAQFDALILELQSITEEARATDYHDTLRKAVLFLNLHRAKVIQYAKDIVRLDGACTEQHAVNVSVCKQLAEANKVIRLAGDALKKTAAPSVSYEILGVIRTYLEGKK